MKKIKKLLCMMLAILLLAFSCAAAVSAEESAGPDMEALQQKFIAYLDEHGVEHEFGGEDSSFVEYIVETNGWIVFYGNPGYVNPAPTSDRISNYVFVHSSWEIPYKLGLYAENNGKILALNEASKQKVVNIKEVVKCQNPYFNVYEPGDTDMDGTVSVKDVLFVQKVIAKKIEMDISYYTFNLCDYDWNKEINIKDVVDMQKKIAKIIR